MPPVLDALDRQGHAVVNCTAMKPDGTPCGAPAREGETTCFFHGEGEAVRAAGAKGGASRNRPVLNLRQLIAEAGALDVDGKQRLLAAVAEKVLAGQLDHASARAVTYAVQTADAVARSAELAALATKLDALEEAQHARH